MEETGKVESPVIPPHEELVDYISKKHYGGKDKEVLAAKLTSDKTLFDKALKEIHQDHFAQKPYEEFRKEYEKNYGNPFPEKKNSIQNSETPQQDILKEKGEQSGNGAQSGSGDPLLNYVMSRIPKSSGDAVPKKTSLDEYVKGIGKLPDLNEHEYDKKIQQDNLLADQEILKNEKLAEESDKSGQELFKNTKGEVKSTDDFLEDNNTWDAFEKNFHNGIITAMQGPEVLMKSVHDLSLMGGKDLESVLLEKSIWDKEQLKIYSTRASDKNIIDNPSDPRAYAAIGGQLTAFAATSLLTAGVGNAANLSSKGALALQASNSLFSTAPTVYIGAKDAGLSDNGAAAMTLVTSPVIAALDLVGLGELLNNNVTRSIVTKTGLEAIQEVTENFTKKFTPELAKKASAMVSSKVPGIVKNITKKSSAEGITEFAQEGISVGSEALYNEFFKDKDEHGYNLEGWQKRMLLSGASGLAGGGVFGLAPNTQSPKVQEMTKAKDALINDLNSGNLSESAKAIVNEQIQSTEAEIKDQIQSEEQIKAEEQAKQEQLSTLDSHKKDLESNLSKEEVSPETKAVLEGKISEIDSQINEIQPKPEKVNEIPKEQTTETTESTRQEEGKSETEALQEGQQLEEKLVEDKKIPIGKNEYSVRKVDSGVEITNETTGKKIDKKSKAYNQALNTYKEDAIPTFTEGKKAEVNEGMKEDDYYTSVLNTSENPHEIAQAYSQAPEGTLDKKEQIIKDNLRKLPFSGVQRFGDTNKLKGERKFKKNYINESGVPLDVQAQEMSDIAGIEIEPQDIIDFIEKYPDGAHTAKAVNSVKQGLADKFYRLTGLELDDAYANKITAESKVYEKAVSDLPEDLITSINNTGITAENIDSLREQFFTGFPYDDEEFQLLKNHFNEQERRTSENISQESERPSDQSQEKQDSEGISEQKRSLQSIRDQARDARDSQDSEKARQVISEIDKILMRENLISGTDASFADPTSPTFFDFLDQNKSVYRLHEDFKLAEGPFDLMQIIDNLPEKFKAEAEKLDVSNGISFDDAFNLGFIDAAKKLGYDGLRMMEIDGTDSTIQVWNFDKLDHIDGPELRKEDKPPVPPAEEKAKAEKEPPKKKLKVAERILDSEMVSDEVKEGLIKKGIHYIPQSNEVTVADAKAIIENHGKDAAYNMVMNTSNEMKDLARGAVARQLFETYSNDSKAADNEAGRMENLNKAVEIASFAAKMFKDAGQTIQSAKMWKRMLQKTPEGMLVAIEKDYSNQREEAISAIEKELKNDKKAIDDFIAENIDKVLDSDIVKKAIDKIIAGKKPKARTKKDISDFFDGLKIKDEPGQLFESTYYIVKSAYNTAIEIIKKAVLKGIDVKDAIQQGIDSINSHPDQVGTWEEDKFRLEMTERVSSFVEPAKDPSKVIENVADKVKKIAKDHYTKGIKSSEGLSEKLVNELGLSPEDANVIAGKIHEEFSKAINKQKSQLLSKISKATNLTQARKDSLIKSIVKEIELGTLDNDRFKELYAESIGVSTLTPEQKKRILELAGTVKAAEDFVDKYKAEFTPENRKKYEKLKFEAGKAFDELSELHGKKKDIWDTMATMMQGNLMTPLSIVKNIYSNMVMQPLRFTTKGVTSALDFLVSQAGKTKIGSKYFDPKRTTDFKASQIGYLKGFYKGGKIGTQQMYHGVPSEDLANRELEAGFRPMRAWANVAQDVKTKNITSKTVKDFTFAFFGSAPELTFRALNFGDKPFSKAAFTAKAQEIGTLAGLKGKELEKFMEFPDEPSMEKIKQAGERATFQQNEGLNKWIQESLSKLLNEIAKMPLVGKPAKLLVKTQMPFVKTPLNIISETIDYAVPPFSLMKGIYYLNKGERVKGLEFVSKAIVGTMIAVVARQLFENGLLSPSSDDNEKVRAMQFEEMPPEGLNITGFLRMMAGGPAKAQKGDTWINYKNLGPLGIIFNTHANRLNDKEGSEEENIAIAYTYDMFSSLPGIASASLEQSFLAGTNTLLTAIKEGGYKLDRWIINTAMTISNIAIPNTVSAASRSTNDSMPDLRGDNFSDQFVNTIKSRYFQGGELPPKVTMWGEPVKQTPEGRNKFIYHFLDPTKNKELRNNEWSYKIYELWKETGDKETLPAVPDRTLTIKKQPKKLTSDQYSQLATFVGRNRARLVRAIVESSGWEKLDNEHKIHKLKKAYESGAKLGAREYKNHNK